MTKETRLLLTLLAGFCDAATFVQMHGIFSAHVTGNFVVFAAALSQGASPDDYLKLLTFPVFVLAVAVGTFIYMTGDTGKSRSRGSSGLTAVLWAMTTLFGIGGAIAIVPHAQAGVLDLLITFVVVVAMGLQNTVHHFIAGAFTTVMTGTVMNWVAAVTERQLAPKASPKTAPPLNPVGLMALFAMGCLAGALLTHLVGFKAFLVPAFLTACLALFETRTAKKEIANA